MAKATDKNRLIRISTQFGADALLPLGISGREELGRLFEYEVDLLSERSGIKPEEILGTNVTVLVRTEKDSSPRYLNAFVTQFLVIGERPATVFSSRTAFQYRAILHPWIWFATRRSDSRIFVGKTVPEIVKEVLGIYGGEISDKLTGEHQRWEYCVQYRESDFNFVSRLMEHEGIYYFFDHQNAKHVLTLIDAATTHVPHPDFKSFPFHQAGARDKDSRDYVSNWSVTTTVQPGKYLHKDYDFFKARVVEGVASQPRGHNFGDLEIYDFPAESVDIAGADGGSDASSAYASVRMEELQCQYRLFDGGGGVRGLQVGKLFALTDHPHRPYNAEYLVVSSSLSASTNDYASGPAGGGDFRVSFRAIKKGEPFRPRRLTPKPLIQGAQTALVVGSGEIDPDKYGRIKVRFHWDRIGATCWVRVAQSVAGKSWGAMFLPRVGQEVMVEFLEGDPDRPVVTGVFYNGAVPPPYALPDQKTKSTIKTNSSEGGGGFNELRFEDKKGNEQVFIHAEKQMDIRVKEDFLRTVGRDQHEIVTRDRFERIDRDDNRLVKGDLSAEIKGSVSLKAGQDLQSKVGMKAALDAGQEIHLKAGMNLIIEAGAQISLKVGGNFINIGPAGVDIQGTMTKVNSGGSAGTGSGASPTPPKEAKEADKATAGSKNDSPPALRPPKPKKYSPAAVALRDAAAKGAPLC